MKQEYVGKTYYCYNRSNNKLASHTLLNPDRALIRNQFGTAEYPLAKPNMPEQFEFRNGTYTTKDKEEEEFLDAMVEGRRYKLSNGSMFEPWLAAVYFKREAEKEKTNEPKTIIKNIEKLVLPEESAMLMKPEAFISLFEKLGLSIPDSAKTKEEYIAILKDNGHII